MSFSKFFGVARSVTSSAVGFAAAVTTAVAQAVEATSNTVANGLSIANNDQVDPDDVSFSNAELVLSKKQRMEQAILECIVVFSPGAAIYDDYGSVTSGILPVDDLP